MLFLLRSAGALILLGLAGALEACGATATAPGAAADECEAACDRGYEACARPPNDDHACFVQASDCKARCPPDPKDGTWREERGCRATDEEMSACAAPGCEPGPPSICLGASGPHHEAELAQRVLAERRLLRCECVCPDDPCSLVP